MNLSFGLGHAVPEAVQSAWGARLIFPDDLLPDRQDLVVADDAEKAALLAWLNPGPVAGIAKMKAKAREAADRYKLARHERKDVVLFKDDVGVIVGNPNASHGYLYVAAWLHNGEADKQPDASFEEIVIPPKLVPDNWEPKVYRPYKVAGKRFAYRGAAEKHAKKLGLRWDAVELVPQRPGDE
jgi:hypothetical protein